MALSLTALFVGGTLHLVRYTGVSGGVLVMERRSSALTDEAAAIFTGP